MKVLVIGGMHGNETLGLEVVDLLTKDPISRVDAIIANSEAVKGNCRFTGKDLNRSFPGLTDGERYEDRRAAEVLSACKAYDVVLDFHNTYCANNDCSFVGDQANDNLFDASVLLGLEKVIVADYNCLNKYAPNCISIEISMDSPRNKAEIWYESIRCLSTIESVRVVSKPKKYTFAYRMTLDDKERLRLESCNLETFKDIGGELAQKLGVSAPAYPIFIADKFTPYNYGGILNAIE
jgi:hypothetical protein